MSYYIVQKCVNDVPIGTYYLRRTDLVSVPDKYNFAYSDFTEIQGICDFLNLHQAVTYQKVYP